MAETAANMPLQDADPYTLGFAAFHCLYKVPEVPFVIAGGRTRSQALDLFSLGSERSHALQSGDQVTIRAVKDRAHAGVVVRRSVQPAHLVGDLQVPVVQCDDLRIGGLAVVLVTEAASQADDPGGKFGLPN